MRILGLSAFHRDAAAALLVDGEVIAAAQEERFTRNVLDPVFPRRAIRSCLCAAGLDGSALDHAIFYEKPLRKFERVLVRSLRAFPRSAGSFSKSAFLWLGERLWIKNRIAEALGLAPEKVLFVEQARSQLANAYYSSPFDDAALLLLDDVCEWSSTVLGHGYGTEVELLLEVRHPHSLGHFVSGMTQFLGFVPGEEEHKLEALASWGEPRRVAELERLFTGPGPFFELMQRPFSFDDGAARLFTSELEQLLGPARNSGEPLRMSPGDSGHADLAASVQRVVEEKVLGLALELKRRTSADNLCLAGLLAENRRLVARLAAEAPFRSIFVPDAPGKSGGALGAAWFAHHALGGKRKAGQARTCAPAESIEDCAEPGARELGSAERVHGELHERLSRGELVGWARGALEFGSRSLGQRVALAHASGTDSRQRLLSALQQVEPFLPCRVAVPAERADEFVDFPASAALAARHARVLAPAREQMRSFAPSALMPDGRVWPQLVEAATDPGLHGLLTRMGSTGGAPLLLLTDLALRGTTLVRSEADAVEAFARSGLDALVAGPRLYLRE